MSLMYMGIKIKEIGVQLIKEKTESIFNDK